MTVWSVVSSAKPTRGAVRLNVREAKANTEKTLPRTLERIVLYMDIVLLSK
jgi:hypothetical protein